MSKKLTYEEVKKYIEQNNYKLLSNTYVNHSSKLDFECDNGHYFSTSWNKFLNGVRCAKCNKNIRRKIKYYNVKKYIESVNYKLLSTEYIDSKHKIEVQCDKGHIYYTQFDNFKSGCRCAECAGVKKKTYNEIKEYIESINYELISKTYNNAKDKLKIKCNKGHVYTVTFDNFKNSGNRCSVCAGLKTKTYDEVKECVEKENYKLISTEYNNVKDKLKLKCPKNHICNINFSNFKQGRRCPYCKISKGEFKIIQWLDDNIINYETQYRFNNCRRKECLPFDFAIFENNSLRFLIEYDGEFHYKPILGKKHLKYQQENDQIKTEYCNNNNIKLLRIPYWEFDNIENILNKEVFNVC